MISQDTSAYGVDTKYKLDTWNGQPLKTRFIDLAKALTQLGIWVRLHYVYPYPHVDDVIPLMAEGKLLPYLDIPFQHASPKLLKLMKRPGNIENTLERIHAWRALCPDLVIRSTFIVGFPGETEEDFELLLDFLREAQLDRVGCFKYSPVEGAPANDLPDQVDEAIKEDRWQRFMALQQDISADKLQQKVGYVLPVIIDEIYPDGALARSFGDAPEIDGNVHIQGAIDAQVGDIIDVLVMGADEYDLYAEAYDDEDDDQTDELNQDSKE